MTLGFGADFISAKRGALYAARTGQPLWLAVILLIALIVVVSLSQMLFAVLAMVVTPLQPGTSLQEIFSNPIKMQELLPKAIVVGILPASLAAAVIAWLVARLGNKTGETGMPLHIPDLGVLGWLVVTAGFVLAMWAFFMATYFVLGIDPQTYSPNDPNSMSGLVEKVIADLVDEPMLLAMAIPGVAIAVPVAEEFVFRGPIFAALRSSWFGQTGAVVLTSAAWAMIHMTAPWLFIFVIFFMGLALGWLLLRFGSLTVTIAAHGVWNLISTLAISGGY
jgi:uncharacterized protein